MNTKKHSAMVFVATLVIMVKTLQTAYKCIWWWHSHTRRHWVVIIRMRWLYMYWHRKIFKTYYQVYKANYSKLWPYFINQRTQDCIRYVYVCVYIHIYGKIWNNRYQTLIMFISGVYSLYFYSIWIFSTSLYSFKTIRRSYWNSGWKY